MSHVRLRTDLSRAKIGNFALPLGLVPSAMPAPTVGYTLEYTPGDESHDEPDTYTFSIVASHEDLAPIIDRMLELLPDRVHGILEIGSRDAYRSLDVYMAPDPISREAFCAGWDQFAPFLLEDGSIGAGANSDDPFIEVFLDQWKGLSVHVPLLMRDDVERVLHQAGLEEVLETWPPMNEDEAQRAMTLRPVLAPEEEAEPAIEDMLLRIRHAWELELNVDPETNVDDSGRELGATLWHTIIIVESRLEPGARAYASIWATASSLAEMEELIDRALSESPDWRFDEVYTIDRVAYDERPDALADLSPRDRDPAVHLVEYDL